MSNEPIGHSLDRPHDGIRRRAPAPGALRSEAALSIQTRQAQQLVHGRTGREDKPAIIGLTRFAALLRPIWNGVRADDPYAAWWLVRVHEALACAWTELGSLHNTVQAQLQTVPGVQIGMAESLYPIEVPLIFANPYGFRAAYLIARFDDLVRAIMTARHVGLLDRDNAERFLHHGGRQVRRAYNSPLGYKYFGITRADIAQGNAKAAQARALMGDVPAAVLSGERAAPYAPAIAVPKRDADDIASGAPTSCAIVEDDQSPLPENDQ
jgi:integrating conjugative element protein (TIGR03761 family)